MAPVPNARVLYKKVPSSPQDYEQCVAYENSQTIDPDTVPLNGGFLMKTIALSMESFLLLRMRDPAIPGPYRAFQLHEPIFSFGIGSVVRSECASVTPGDYVYVQELPFQEYNVLSGADIARVIKPQSGVAPEAYTSPAGMAGQTAYYGWREYALPKKGDTVFVSSGGGAVGSFIIQMAKAEGLKVITSAGTEDKIAFAKECGADVVFNYKTENTAEILQKEGPINIYWDNVSGETLDAALGAAATGARFIACGANSRFNSSEPKMKNLINLVTREIKLSGYIVTSLHDKYVDEFYDVVPKMIAAGKLKYNLEVKALAESGRGLHEACSGTNSGKVTIVL